MRRRTVVRIATIVAFVTLAILCVFALLTYQYSPVYNWSYTHIPGKVLAQFNIELPCPVNSAPASSTLTVTLNPANGAVRQNFCVDNTTGHLIFQGDSGGINGASGPPTGTCQPNQVYLDTSNGTLYTCNGGTWTPATGAAAFTYASSQLGAVMSSTTGTGGVSLTQTGTNVQPGTFLAGPIPVGGSNNSSFQNFNTNAATTGTPSVTLAPIVANSVAIYTQINALANHTAPDGTGWTAIDTALPSGSVYWKSVSSTSALTASTTFSSTTWNASLIFVGGSSLTKAHTSTGFSTACGVGCATVSLTETSGALEFAIVTWSSASTDLNAMSVSDSCGNQYTPISHTYPGGGSGVGLWILISQFAKSGSCTLTFQANEVPSFAINIASATVYDLTGATSYFTGPNGPFSFRNISPLDLFGATGSLGFSSIKTATSTGCTTAATSFSNCDVTLNWSGSGFPDTNYYPVCSLKDTAMQASGGDGSTGDVPGPVTIRSFSATQIVATERTDAARALTNTNITIYCIGVHP